MFPLALTLILTLAFGIARAVLTLASSLCILSFLVGLSGILLDSRPIMAFYNLLLWPAFLSITIIGYTAYKRGNLQLDKKLNQAWSQWLSVGDKLVIQESLGCCGYYNPFRERPHLHPNLTLPGHSVLPRSADCELEPSRRPQLKAKIADSAIYSGSCYPRTQLPGCKVKWTTFEQQALRNFSDVAFSILPFHILNIIIALLCSNHITRQVAPRSNLSCCHSLTSCVGLLDAVGSHMRIA